MSEFGNAVFKVLCEMKWMCLFLFFLLLCFESKAQAVDFAPIDAYVSSVNEKTPEALAKKLTAPFTTQKEKVSAIFRWITENIAYNTIVYKKPSQNRSSKYKTYEIDNSSDPLPSLNEHVAQLVIQRRVAVCDGYARLFKTLCDYAGIRSEIVFGYARTNFGRVGKRFFSNHTWNAVYIDSTWHLVDATWASGYVNFGESFVKDFNAAYFLTPPQEFIQDHYPELIYWSLLSSPPTLREFQFSPFKNQAYIKFKIQSFKPATGIIDAAVGDTLEFEIETSEDVKQFFVSANPYFELGVLPLISTLPYGTFDFKRQANKVLYRYILTSQQVKQLHVVFNDRVILQYKVQAKNNWASSK